MIFGTPNLLTRQGRDQGLLDDRFHCIGPREFPAGGDEVFAEEDHYKVATATRGRGRD